MLDRSSCFTALSLAPKVRRTIPHVAIGSARAKTLPRTNHPRFRFTLDAVRFAPARLPTRGPPALLISVGDANHLASIINTSRNRAFAVETLDALGGRRTIRRHLTALA
jgi:hypothetical protein